MRCAVVDTAGAVVVRVALDDAREHRDAPAQREDGLVGVRGDLGCDVGARLACPDHEDALPCDLGRPAIVGSVQDLTRKRPFAIEMRPVWMLMEARAEGDRVELLGLVATRTDRPNRPRAVGLSRDRLDSRLELDPLGDSECLAVRGQVLDVLPGGHVPAVLRLDREVRERRQQPGGGETARFPDDTGVLVETKDTTEAPSPLEARRLMPFLEQLLDGRKPGRPGTDDGDAH